MDLGNLKRIGFGDMHLWAVQWDSDGRDFVLRVELGDGTRAQLRCMWATSVRIDIGKGAHDGPPLTWAGSIDATSEGTHDVTFDFASAGNLSLRCNDVLVTDW